MSPRVTVGEAIQSVLAQDFADFEIPLSAFDPVAGVVTYTTDNGYVGSDSFTFTASYGGQTSAPASASSMTSSGQISSALAIISARGNHFPSGPTRRR